MRNNKTKILIGLGVLLLVMGVGYAALMTNLTINGTAEISGKWDIYISNITEKALKDATTIDTNIEGKITANFNVDLEKPGSYAEYEVTVKNDGNLDAVLKGINGIDEANLLAPTDIEYSIEDLELDSSLPAGGEITFTVRVDFKTTATVLPTTNKVLTLTLDFEQETKSSGEVTPPVDPDVVTGVAHQVIADKNVDGNTEGLITDTTADHNIRYVGSDVKNYVTFNNETWRIVGIFDGKVKIVSEQSVATRPYDTKATNGINNFPTSDIKEYLNGEYLDSLNSKARNMISEHVYYLGAMTSPNDKEAQYQEERGTFDQSGSPVRCSVGVDGETSETCPRATTWTGKVGLLYYSDVLYSAWLKSSASWLISIGNFNTSNVHSITPSLSYMASRNANENYDVCPTLHLNPDVKITGGDGTSANPYQLSM